MRDALDKVNWQEVTEALRVMAAIMSATGSTCKTVSGR
jgi:hypothetical protein